MQQAHPRPQARVARCGQHQAVVVDRRPIDVAGEAPSVCTADAAVPHHQRPAKLAGVRAPGLRSETSPTQSPPTWSTQPPPVRPLGRHRTFTGDRSERRDPRAAGVLRRRSARASPGSARRGPCMCPAQASKTPALRSSRSTSAAAAASSSRRITEGWPSTSASSGPASGRTARTSASASVGKYRVRSTSRAVSNQASAAGRRRARAASAEASTTLPPITPLGWRRPGGGAGLPHRPATGLHSRHRRGGSRPLIRPPSRCCLVSRLCIAPDHAARVSAEPRPFRGAGPGRVAHHPPAETPVPGASSAPRLRPAPRRRPPQ